jgi:D-psicose/D-tagatose/L-ribulose 3-epimerase
MKYGVNTFIWTASFERSNLPLLPRIKEAGFDGFEVPLFRPERFAAAEIRQGGEEYGLEPTVCSVLVSGMSLIDSDSNVRRQTRAHLAECIQATADAGSKLIAGPLYSPVGFLTGLRRTREQWQWAVDAWQELGPVLATNGVTAAIEPLNRFETFFLNTCADAAAFAAEVAHPNVGILFDTFHANIEEKSVAGGLRQVAPYLKHVHACENDRGTPGSGHVDWPAVFAALREIRYDAWLTIESFGFALGELSAAASIWRDLANTPEEIAFAGVQFLRSGMAMQAAG